MMRRLGWWVYRNKSKSAEFALDPFTHSVAYMHDRNMVSNNELFKRWLDDAIDETDGLEVVTSTWHTVQSKATTSRQAIRSYSGITIGEVMGDNVPKLQSSFVVHLLKAV